MKNSIYLFVFIFFAGILYGCKSKQLIYDMQTVPNLVAHYQSQHPIRRSLPLVESSGVGQKEVYFSNFFLFGPGSLFSKSGYEKSVRDMYVSFTWCIKDSIYITSTFPIERIRFKVSVSQSIPTASFILYADDIKKSFDYYAVTGRYSNTYNGALKHYKIWNSVFADYINPEFAFREDGFLNYVLITLNPNDWPAAAKLAINN